MTTANLDSSIALKSSGLMDAPRSRFSSSLNVVKPPRFNASNRWLVKFFRVSKPLKLTKTSYLYLRLGVIEEEEEGENEEEAFSLLIEAIENYYRYVLKSVVGFWTRSEERVRGGANISRRSVLTYRSALSLLTLTTRSVRSGG